MIPSSTRLVAYLHKVNVCECDLTSPSVNWGRVITMAVHCLHAVLHGLHPLRGILSQDVHFLDRSIAHTVISPPAPPRDFELSVSLNFSGDSHK